MILIMYSLSDTLRTDSYETLGIVSIALIFIIIILSIWRTVYTFYRIFR